MNVKDLKVWGDTRKVQKIILVFIFLLKLKDIKVQKDLNNLLTLWDEIKDWSKSTGKNPNDYFKTDEVIKSSLTTGELFDNYLEHYEKIVIIWFYFTEKCHPFLLLKS